MGLDAAAVVCCDISLEGITSETSYSHGIEVKEFARKESA